MNEIHQQVPQVPVPSSACVELLQHVDQWDLDMFHLYDLSDDSPATFTGLKIMTDLGLWDLLPLHKVSWRLASGSKLASYCVLHYPSCPLPRRPHLF